MRAYMHTCTHTPIDSAHVSVCGCAHAHARVCVRRVCVCMRACVCARVCMGPCACLLACMYEVKREGIC